MGDINIPILTDKQTDISKEVVQKNFVDSPPQAYELTPNLESGSYTAVLHEGEHSRSENFTEQRDSIRSLPQRHGTEFPFDWAGDTGHVLPESSTTSITPSEEIEQAELSLRFLESDTFQPGINTTATAISTDFSPTPEESIIAIPDTSQNVQDVNGNSQSALATVSSENATFEYYTYQDLVFQYELPSNNYTQIERDDPVRMYNSSDERVYSDKGLKTGSYVENGLIRGTYNSSSIGLEEYDSGWTSFGDITVPSEQDGYAKKNENYMVESKWIDSHISTVFRGWPVFQVDVDSISTFTFTADSSITVSDSGSWYRIVNDGTRDIFVVRASSDGSFSVSSPKVEVTGLNSSTEYTFFVGYIPSTFTNSDFVRYVFNRGSWDRTFIQK